MGGDGKNLIPASNLSPNLGTKIQPHPTQIPNQIGDKWVGDEKVPD